MKGILKLTLAIAAFLVIGCTTHASAQKMGYIAASELVAAMPETAEVNKKMVDLEKEFTDIFTTKREQYNKLLEDYNANEATMTEAVRKTKIATLDELGASLSNYPTEARQTMEENFMELMQPVYEKAKKAIEVVAKENSIVIVYDTSTGALAYFDPSAMTDLMPMVKQHLGIK